MNFNILIVLLIIQQSCHCFDIFFTPLIIGGFSAVAYYSFGCKLSGTCCTEKEIPANFQLLNHFLENQVFGQPVLSKELVYRIRVHWNPIYAPRKSLVLSFNGSPGTGKNYAASLIAKALYKDGLKNPHVHLFTKNHFLLPSNDINEYNRSQLKLKRSIKTAIKACPKQLFIFDEVDKLSHGILNVLVEELKLSWDNPKRSIFIFISNSGEQQIITKSLELWQNGISREDIKIDDFKDLQESGSFDLKGGFSENVHSLIDAYIPFLPLGEDQVRKCIMVEFKRLGVHKPSEEQIEEIYDYVSWGPSPENIFAKTGCKRIAQNVAMHVNNL